MKVLILKGSVRYRGQTYLPGEAVNMVEGDAQRLIDKGIARTMSIPRKQRVRMPDDQIADKQPDMDEAE